MSFTIKVDNVEDIANGERIQCFDEDGKVVWTSIADGTTISVEDRLPAGTEFEDLRTTFYEVAAQPAEVNIESLANQLAVLTGAVDELILNELMGGGF